MAVGEVAASGPIASLFSLTYGRLKKSSLVLSPCGTFILLCKGSTPLDFPLAHQNRQAYFFDNFIKNGRELHFLTGHGLKILLKFLFGLKQLLQPYCS